MDMNRLVLRIADVARACTHYPFVILPTSLYTYHLAGTLVKKRKRRRSPILTFYFEETCVVLIAILVSLASIIYLRLFSDHHLTDCTASPVANRSMLPGVAFR